MDDAASPTASANGATLSLEEVTNIIQVGQRLCSGARSREGS
jgi:hypothetical protein